MLCTALLSSAKLEVGKRVTGAGGEVKLTMQGIGDCTKREKLYVYFRILVEGMDVGEWYFRPPKRDDADDYMECTLPSHLVDKLYSELGKHSFTEESLREVKVYKKA